MKANRQRNIQGFVFLSCLLVAFGLKAATFDIVFFDANKQQVGQGRFKTDPSRTTCVEAHVLGSCGNPREPIYPGGPNQYELGYVIDRNNPLIDFSSTIQGVSWGFEPGGMTWWSADNQTPGSQLGHRYGVFVSNDFWFFGDAFFGLRQFFMAFNQATASSGSGMWGQQTGYDRNGNPFPDWVYGGGDFIVTQTPIPAAIWLFASALATLGVFKQKKAGI